MSALAIIGTGRLGQAIGVGLHRFRPQVHSGRTLLGKRDLANTLGDEARVVIHASGPAGEAACKEDPGLAFGLHYTLTERLATWAAEQSGRRLVLLGTVAPNTGFYGPLKRAAIARAHALTTALTVVECGHVIGEGLGVTDHNAGVVARFVRAAVQGSRLQIAGGGEQTLRYTPLATLIHLLRTLVDERHSFSEVSPPQILSPVSAPVTVVEIGRTCLSLARLLYTVDRGVMVETPHRQLQPNYEDPTGEPVPVLPLNDVLVQWMRTVEVKLLLGTR